MRTSLRKGLVAVAAVLGIVAVTAPPASADPTIEGTIALGFEFVVPSDPGNCPMSQSLPITFTGDAINGAWDASDGAFKLPWSAPWGPDKYQVEIDLLPTSVGTYTQTSAGPPPTYALAGRLDIRATFQTLTKVGDPEDPDECTKTNLCTIQARLPLDPSVSVHTGSLPTPGAGDTTDIDASSANPGGFNTFVVGGTCPVTLSFFIVYKVATMFLTSTWP
jgi:hypothetical protein